MDIHPRLNVLDCFSGYGGFSLGLRLAFPDADFRTVAYIEWDKYCQELLQQRFRDDPPTLDPAPIWDDIKSFDGRPWRGTVDILTAGFPCQPHSNAGLRKGADDDRNLWPDCLRVISEVAPRTGILLENVPGILVGSDGRPPYGGTVVGELAEVGGGSWHIPTPTSADVYTGNMESSQQSDDSMHSVSLPDFVNRWPTPDAGIRGSRSEGAMSADKQSVISKNGQRMRGTDLSTAAHMFPTPSTMDHIDRKQMRPSRAATNRKTGYLSEMIGNWPTPTPTPRNETEPIDQWLARREREKALGRNGNGFGIPLDMAVRMWPTPTSTERSDTKRG
jgi:hypothetical protein